MNHQRETSSGANERIFTYPPGVPLILFAIALFKALVMSRRISADWQRLCYWILRPDLLTLGVVLLLLAASRIVERKLWRMLALVPVLAICSYQVIDTEAVLLLGERVHPSDLVKFAPDVGVVVHMVSVSKFLLFGALTVCALQYWRSCRTAELIVLAAAGVLMISTSSIPARAPAILQHYEHSIFWYLRELFQRPSVAAYSEAESRAAVEPFSLRPRFSPIPGRPNLVIVLVESLSAMYSLRTSQIDDAASSFDELTKQGTLFDNFIANDSNSEGALIAMLSGDVPLGIIGGSSLMHREYAAQPSAVPEMLRAGYNVEFLASTPISFASKVEYLKAIGVSPVRGRDEVPRFKGAPRFAFSSPPDALLYDEALERIDALERARRPYILVIVTGTSHQPYWDPLGRANTIQNVFSYVGDELRSLHERLQQRGFYRNGILAALGDHHDMYPVREKEVQRYGDSASARVPLLFIGKGIPAGVIDHRPFQESDFLVKLPAAIGSHGPLSANVYHVERAGGGNYPIAAKISVFDASSELKTAATIGVEGARLWWITPPPPNGDAVLEAFREQRAAAQEIRRRRMTNCTFPAPDLGSPTARHGVVVEVFRGDLMRADTGEAAEQRLSRTEVANTDISEMLATIQEKVFTVQISGYFAVPTAGNHFFNAAVNESLCAAIDGQTVIDANTGTGGKYPDGSMVLSDGLHPFVLRYVFRSHAGKPFLRFGWFPPGMKANMQQYPPIPDSLLVLPGE